MINFDFITGFAESFECWIVALYFTVYNKNRLTSVHILAEKYTFLDISVQLQKQPKT